MTNQSEARRRQSFEAAAVACNGTIVSSSAVQEACAARDHALPCAATREPRQPLLFCQQDTTSLAQLWRAAHLLHTDSRTFTVASAATAVTAYGVCVLDTAVTGSGVRVETMSLVTSE